MTVGAFKCTKVTQEVFVQIRMDRGYRNIEKISNTKPDLNESIQMQSMAWVNVISLMQSFVQLEEQLVSVQIYFPNR